jgi:hypothetical protein
VSAVYDKTELESQSTRITTATTTAIRTGKTLLRRIIIGATAAGTISVQDDDTTVRVLLGASFPVGSYEFNLVTKGLRIVTGAASDITVVYAPLV